MVLNLQTSITDRFQLTKLIRNEGFDVSFDVASQSNLEWFYQLTKGQALLLESVGNFSRQLHKYSLFCVDETMHVLLGNYHISFFSGEIIYHCGLHNIYGSPET